MKRAHSCILLLVLVAYATAQAPARLLLTVPNAVAIAGTPESAYYVLSSDSAIYRYMRVGSDFRYAGKFVLQDPRSGVDMTLAKVGQDESVIVTQWMKGTSRGSIYRYASDGKVLKVWTVQHVPTGIVFDPSTRVAYFGTYDSNELYAVEIDGDGSEPKVVRNIVQAMNISALALDPEQQIIYASDRNGAIFAVDLHSKRVTQLKVSFALPAALLFHSPTKSLYVADEVKRKVYAVSIASQKNQVVAESIQIQSPSGLAIGPENSIVISDKKSGAVMQVAVEVIPKELGTRQTIGAAGRINAPSFDQAPAFVRSIFLNAYGTNAADSYEMLDDSAKAQLLNIYAFIQKASVGDPASAESWNTSSIVKAESGYMILKTSQSLPASLQQSPPYSSVMDRLFAIPGLPEWKRFERSFKTPNNGTPNLHITFLKNRSAPDFYYADLRIDLSSVGTAIFWGHDPHKTYKALAGKNIHPPYSWVK
jgi:sugar lactone lactonase YvrE